LRYELVIGWRFVRRKSKSRAAVAGLCAGAALLAGGVALVVASDGGSPLGVIAVFAGMIATAVAALLLLFDVFNLVSVLGVVFGVAALTTVLAVTTGLQREFRSKVLGVKPHILIYRSIGDFSEYRNIVRDVEQVEGVSAAAPFAYAEMLMASPGKDPAGVAVNGVDPSSLAAWPFARYLVEGSMDSLLAPAEGAAPDGQGTAPAAPPLPGIVLGQTLAKRLRIGMGDQVTLVMPFSSMDSLSGDLLGSAPRAVKLRVTGILSTGFDEFDRRFTYVALPVQQELMGLGDVVLGVQLRLHDPERAGEVAAALETALHNRPYLIEPWHETDRNLFSALSMQKLVISIILCLIIVVAAFNMVSALTMMVTDKTREIAILGSMGASQRGIGRIFQMVGIGIGAVGTATGLAIGLVTCSVVARYGYRLDPKVYLIDRLPIAIEPLDVALVVGATMLICLLATLVPSARASSLRPVDGLRYD
jgi:lipoprotein-releasing system permease protein